MDRLEERYLKDPSFHMFVVTIENLLEKMYLTPSEAREATMLACLRFEARHPQTFQLSYDQIERIKHETTLY